MKRGRLVGLVLLLNLLLVAACGGQATPAPRPVATTDLSGISLAPYTDRWFGIRGVLPEGWFQVDRGFFLAGPPEDQPVTVHVQQVLGGLTLAQAQDYLLPWLSLEEFPEPVGQRDSQSYAWYLYSYEHQDPRLGARKNDVALAETEEGVHLVLLATAPEEYEVLHEQVFLPAVDAMGPAADDASLYQTYAGWPSVAVLDQVGNSAHETAEFSLDQCTRLRVYGLGEGTQAGMTDFGYVENAETGQVVWQMRFFETDAAGSHSNRRVDRTLTLPPGTYRLHFETDDAHAFDDWGNRAPGHPFWGIALFEDQDPASAPASCWERANRPEDLGWSSDILNKEIATAFEKSGAAALMIVTDGQVVLELGNTANNYRAHSMRKSLMSALYGLYISDGEIEASRTLADLGIDDIVPLTETEKKATVLDLLQARSGVYIPAAGEAQSMREDRPKRGSHEPGSFWYYNNWDFNALGTILGQETGESFYQAFDQRIAQPVGMQDFAPERLLYTYEYWLSQHPYYGTRISARDLARFGQLFLQEGAWQGTQVVPSDWVAASTTVHSSTGDRGTYSGYGYMWWIAAKDDGAIKKGSYAASGYGGHTLEVLPDLNTVIVLRVNTDAPGWQAINEPDEAIQGILGARID
jgi:CubicO group peptidase (beta-lactamase class C family)